MGFELRLVVPLEMESSPIFNPEFDLSHASRDEMEEIESDPSPTFFSLVADELGRRGARLEVKGLFEADLPIMIDADLPFVLEALPGLIGFLSDSSASLFTIGLWSQSIQTEIDFERKGQVGYISVKARPGIDRPLKQSQEQIALSALGMQVWEFVRVYEAAVCKVFPQLLTHPWNKKLFQLAKHLRAIHSNPPMA